MVTLNHPASNSPNWYQAVADNWDAIETRLLDQNLVSAKGDLIVAPSPSSFSRLGVGSDGQVLMADSTQTPGMRWATVHTAGQVAVSTVRGTTADSTSSTTFATLNSMSLTISVTSPQKVLLAFNAGFGGTSNLVAILQLLRGTTVLNTTCVGGYGGTWTGAGALFSLDQPGTGNFTYSVQWAVSIAGYTINQNLQPYAATGDRQLSGIVLPF